MDELNIMPCVRRQGVKMERLMATHVGMVRVVGKKVSLATEQRVVGMYLQGVDLERIIVVEDEIKITKL